MPITTTGSGFAAGAMSAYVGRIGATIEGPAQQRVVRQAGFAAKRAGLDAVETKLGSDRAMSGYKGGRIKLGVGFDQTGWRLDVNHRPMGLWILADGGRKRTGPIYPRVGRRKATRTTPFRAVSTPYGPRASARFTTPSRGTKVFAMASAREREAAPKAAWGQLQQEIRQAVRR